MGPTAEGARTRSSTQPRRADLDDDGEFLNKPAHAVPLASARQRLENQKRKTKPAIRRPPEPPPEAGGGQPGSAPPPLAENPSPTWPPMPSTARPLLAGRIFFGAGGCLPTFGTAWASLRLTNNHQAGYSSQRAGCTRGGGFIRNDLCAVHAREREPVHMESCFVFCVSKSQNSQPQPAHSRMMVIFFFWRASTELLACCCRPPPVRLWACCQGVLLLPGGVPILPRPVYGALCRSTGIAQRGLLPSLGLP